MVLMLFICFIQHGYHTLCIILHISCHFPACWCNKSKLLRIIHKIIWFQINRSTNYLFTNLIHILIMCRNSNKFIFLSILFCILLLLLFKWPWEFQQIMNRAMIETQEKLLFIKTLYKSLYGRPTPRPMPCL